MPEGPAGRLTGPSWGTPKQITGQGCIDTPRGRNQNTRLGFAEGYPSGQREQTVNLPAYAFEGSNPSPSTTSGGVGEGGRFGWQQPADRRHQRGCSSMVEPQPSKLMTWVRFPLPAPCCSAAVTDVEPM